MKTFQPNKTITELWIDTTRKFVVVKWDDYFKEGDILELIRDDDTRCPKFRNQAGIESYFYLEDIYYADEQQNEQQEKPKKTISWTATTSEWVTYTEDTIHESWYDILTIEQAKEQVKEWRAKATKLNKLIKEQEKLFTNK